MKKVSLWFILMLVLIPPVFSVGIMHLRFSIQMIITHIWMLITKEDTAQRKFLTWPRKCGASMTTFFS